MVTVFWRTHQEEIAQTHKKYRQASLHTPSPPQSRKVPLCPQAPDKAVTGRWKGRAHTGENWLKVYLLHRSSSKWESWVTDTTRLGPHIERLIQKSAQGKGQATPSKLEVLKTFYFTVLSFYILHFVLDLAIVSQLLSRWRLFYRPFYHSTCSARLSLSQISATYRLLIRLHSLCSDANSLNQLLKCWYSDH